MLSAILKSTALLTCNTLTSLASPWIIAPLGELANDLALVVPLGRTRNNTFAEDAVPSTNACDKPSNERKSPRYCSTNPLP